MHPIKQTRSKEILIQTSDERKRWAVMRRGGDSSSEVQKCLRVPKATQTSPSTRAWKDVRATPSRNPQRQNLQQMIPISQTAFFSKNKTLRAPVHPSGSLWNPAVCFPVVEEAFAATQSCCHRAQRDAIDFFSRLTKHQKSPPA